MFSFSAPSAAQVLFVESVAYTRFVVRFQTRDGLVRRMVRFSPMVEFLANEVRRELSERFGDRVVGAVTIQAVAS